MSIPASCVQIAIPPLGTPALIPGGGRTPISTTLGLSYRIHNRSTSVDLFVFDASTGGTGMEINPGTYFTLEKASLATYWLIAGSSVGAETVVEPLLTDDQSGAFRSPLSCVLLAANSPEHSKLVGTFFGVNGEELVFDGHAEVTIELQYTSPNVGRTLGHYLPGTPDHIYVDAYEFRGNLYGAPIRYVPSSPRTVGSDVASAYEPGSNSPLICPGPVVIRSGGVVTQSSTNPGHYGVPTNKISTSVSGAMGGAMIADISSSVLGILLFKWNAANATNAKLQVQAFRRATALDNTEMISTNASVDETFLSSAEQVNHIELEQGIYQIYFSLLSSGSTTVEALIQRFQ